MDMASASVSSLAWPSSQIFASVFNPISPLSATFDTVDQNLRLSRLNSKYANHYAPDFIEELLVRDPPEIFSIRDEWFVKRNGG